MEDFMGELMNIDDAPAYFQEFMIKEETSILSSRFPVAPDVLKTWPIIYPAYLDQNLPVSKGRRLGKEKLDGCTDVTIHDLAEACSELRIVCVHANKRYPKSDFSTPGRLHCRLFDEQGNPTHRTIMNKTQLMEEIAKRIPFLEGRKKRLAKIASMRARVAESLEQKAQKALPSSEKKKSRK